MRIKSFEARLKKNRRFTEKLSDDINRIAGNFGFFVIHVIVFTAWLVINTGQIKQIHIFDPFPFSLLTTMVSLEAIFLSIFVLMSQGRESTIQSLREEIHLQVNQIAEREITKSLHILTKIHEKVVGPLTDDPELARMLKALDTGQIEETLGKQMEPQPMVIEELAEEFERKIMGRKK